MNEDEEFLISVRVVPDVYVVPGSERFFCERCSHLVWVAPSGMEFLRAHDRCTILCIICYAQTSAAPMTPAQREEIKLHLGEHP